ncbi:hypothetical protein ACFLTH_09675 [Bacteroidota bacterium]
MSPNLHEIEDKVKETYTSVFTYFQSLSMNETYAWIAIALGVILVIIGLFML